ncbi:hypothetical protein DSUL_20514 [Desulfovibrionales bacterium]
MLAVWIIFKLLFILFFKLACCPYFILFL